MFTVYYMNVNKVTKLTFTHFLPFDELTFVQVSIPLDHVFD